MKKRMKGSSRVLSFVLALCLIVGMIPAMAPSAGALYNTNNAPAATEDMLGTTADTYTMNEWGGVQRIIDGKLYVWGSNTNYGLGLEGVTSLNTPTEHPYNTEWLKKEHGGLKKIDTAYHGATVALTNNGTMFVWGDYLMDYFYSRTTNAEIKAWGGKTPRALDITNVTEAEETLVDMWFSGITLVAKSDKGNLWVAGCHSPDWSTYWLSGEKITADTSHIFVPLAETFIDQMQDSYNPDTKTVDNENEREGKSLRRKVDKIIPSAHGGATLIITDDDKLFSIGLNSVGTALIAGSDGTGIGESRSMPVNVLEAPHYGQVLAENKVILDSINLNDYNGTFLDEAGNVWFMGLGAQKIVDTGYVGVNRYDGIHTPVKIYDAKSNGVKAVRTYLSPNIAIILTADNSLYARGLNVNNFISTVVGADKAVTTPTPVFEDLSLATTITGAYVCNQGVMALTASGDQYYAGDNSSGTMGNGTNTSPDPGTVEGVEQGTIQPVQPISDNKISFEIETADKTKYVAYDDPNTKDEDESLLGWVQATDKDGNVTILNSNPDSENAADFMTIDAGQNFKLNVYFEDFAKLNAFVIPIRFNRKYVRVVNSNGVEYALGEPVTPGAIGGTTGIDKGFTSQTWNTGVLVGEAGSKGTYPKICNSDGWVSVMGYTTDPNAGIDGKQLMFSITFSAIAQIPTTDENPLTSFGIATQDAQSSNVYDYESFYGDGYDKSALEDFGNGAVWEVYNTANPEKSGYFKFETEFEVEDDDMENLFPSFKTNRVSLKKIALLMSRSDGSSVADQTVSVDVSGVPVPHTGPAISWKNSEEIYTVKVDPDPGNASYPQVTWAKSLPSHSGTFTEYTDYITIVEEKDTYIRFKVADNFSLNEVGVVTFTATPKDTSLGAASQSINVIITTFDPPKTISIVDNNGQPATSVVYNYTENAPDDKYDTENKQFFVKFTPADDDLTSFNNTAVTWRVFDMNGQELDISNPANAISLTPTAATGIWYETAGYTDPQVMIVPQKTLLGDTYVKVRVESLYDPSVYDEMTVKVQFQVDHLNIVPDSIVLPTNTSRDLSMYLEIGPENNYYASNLVWTYAPVGDPYVISNGTSVFTATGEQTPHKDGHSGNAAEDFVAEYITVTDTISGMSDKVQIIVRKLDVPFMPSDVEVTNLVGYQGDYVEIKKGLVQGDTLIFRNATPESSEVVGTYTIDNIPNTSTPGDKFQLPSVLNRAGGEITLTVVRPVEGGDDYIYDPMPLLYNPEPSKVYGYARLSGKNNTNARNSDIMITLTGLSNPDPIYADANGYFEFDTYIRPGTYTLSLYCDNYLKRTIKQDVAVGYAGLIIPSVDEFAISTEDAPILLYPGDINADGLIGSTDLNYYVRNWVGQTSTSLTGFDKFDFHDDSTPVINLRDLTMVVARLGLVREEYPKWYVPGQ